MRIISYRANIPYEESVIRYEGGNIFAHCNNERFLIGQYLSEERAEEVFYSIINAYLDGKQIFEMPEE